MMKALVSEIETMVAVIKRAKQTEKELERASERERCLERSRERELARELAFSSGQSRDQYDPSTCSSSNDDSFEEEFAPTRQVCLPTANSQQILSKIDRSMFTLSTANSVMWKKFEEEWEARRKSL